jgi:hypothetical protein
LHRFDAVAGTEGQDQQRGEKDRDMDGTIVAETEHSQIVLTSFGFYGQCKHGCPWVGAFSHAKFKARMDAEMHDADPNYATWHANRPASESTS